MKTTVYLSNELKQLIKNASILRGIPENQVIVEALHESLKDFRVTPRGGLYNSLEGLSDRADEMLATGFGEDL